jgi:hypothetical protein
MDDTERHVAKFLATSGYTPEEIIFEPDGQVTPDFLIRKRIAVEARRLNQIYEDNGAIEGLEETSIPFYHRIRKMVLSFGPPTADHSWFVSYNFRRPEIPWHILRPALKELFSDFVRNSTVAPREYNFGKSLRIEIEPSNLRFKTFFVLGVHTDRQQGGWVVSETIRNLTLCVSEKAKKLESYKARYPEWWLVLVDRIAFGGWDDDDIADIRKNIKKQPDWDRIVIVDPANTARSFEL